MTTRIMPHTSVWGQFTAALRRHESVAVWLTLMGCLALVKVALDTWFPAAFADPAQAAYFAWPAIGIFTMVGAAAAWLAGRTGFPAPWSDWVKTRQAVLLPVALGLALSVAPVIIDLFTGYAARLAATRGVAQQHTGYVEMLLIFSAAAVIVELVYRLALIPLLLWLVSSVLLRGRGRAPIFWTLAALTSLIEPLTQLPDSHVIAGLPAAILVLNGFGVNLVQAACLWRYGFLAAITVRVAYYLVWHVLYIH